jgi:hypothetical protein
MPDCCRLYKNAILRRSKYAYTLPGYCSDRYTFAGLDEEVPKAPQNASYLHRLSKNLQLHVDSARVTSVRHNETHQTQYTYMRLTKSALA